MLVGLIRWVFELIPIWLTGIMTGPDYLQDVCDSIRYSGDKSDPSCTVDCYDFGSTGNHEAFTTFVCGKAIDLITTTNVARDRMPDFSIQLFFTRSS